ncbi:MAG: hypothetical protein ACI88A_004656 [Paraglaciecola sp.]|jgi:hypothetical protein
MVLVGTTKLNLKDDDIPKLLSRYTEIQEQVQLSGNFVFVKQEGEWKFLFGKLSEACTREFEQIEYPNYLFISKSIEYSSLTQMFSDINNGTFEIAPNLILKKKPNGWRETLLPSKSTASQNPVRLYEIKVQDPGQFNEEILVGYNLPVYKSSASYFQKRFDLDVFHSYSDGRLGCLQIELEDRRGRISIFDNTLKLEAKEESCITGFYLENEVKTEMRLMNGEDCIWPNEGISEYELFLVSKDNEILDHFSSSFSPCITGSMRSETEFAKQVQQAVNAGENEHTEFKVYIDLKDSGKAKEIEKTVCAFSNKSGGYLIIGVADDGTVKGVARDVGRHNKGNIDNYFNAVTKRLTEKLRLPNCYNAKLVDVLGETLLVLHVNAVDDCNYVLDDNIAFIRRGATSARATPEECARLYGIKRHDGSFLASLTDVY